MLVVYDDPNQDRMSRKRNKTFKDWKERNKLSFFANDMNRYKKVSK